MTTKKKSAAKKPAAKKAVAAVGRPAFAPNLVAPGTSTVGPNMIMTRQLAKAGTQTIALVRSTPVDVSTLRSTTASTTRAKSARRTK